MSVNPRAPEASGASLANGGASVFAREYVEEWRCAATLRAHTGDVLHVDWSASDWHLASASVDNTVIVWNVAELPRASPLTILRGHTGLVKGVAWDPAGRFIASQARYILCIEICQALATSACTILVREAQVVPHRKGFLRDRLWFVANMKGFEAKPRNCSKLNNFCRSFHFHFVKYFTKTKKFP